MDNLTLWLYEELNDLERKYQTEMRLTPFLPPSEAMLHNFRLDCQRLRRKYDSLLAIQERARKEVVINVAA